MTQRTPDPDPEVDPPPPNPYAAVPAPPAATTSPVEHLSTAESWRLLETASLGRLAIDRDDGAPDLLPLNYRVHSGTIVMRTAPGGKLRSIATRPAVAFEVDGENEVHRWSVVIRGLAERMSVDAEIEESGVLDLVSASPTEKHDFIRLTPKSVTGRRFAKPVGRGRGPGQRGDGDPSARPQTGAHAVSRTDAASAASSGSVAHAEKPTPIPHRPPLPAPPD
jgi:nitroimidazol reductase NimA-like FMN-containing flavoprotein (pyridoxamine 5'-phosphate oxidase superfamily)